MVEFYKQLKDDKDKATALQQAQMKIMSKEEYSHPENAIKIIQSNDNNNSLAVIPYTIQNYVFS